MLNGGLFKGTMAWNIFVPEYAPNQCVYQGSILVFFLKFGLEIWLKSKVSKTMGPWNWGMDFLVALITFNIDFLVALNGMSLPIALNTIAWVFLLL